MGLNAFSLYWVSQPCKRPMGREVYCPICALKRSLIEGTRSMVSSVCLRLALARYRSGMNREEQLAAIQKVITDNGGKLVGAWFTQGDYDLISIIDAEDDQVMRTISARLAVKGLYTGKTLPAMTMDAFIDKFGDGPEVGMFIEAWFRAGRKDKRR